MYRRFRQGIASVLVVIALITTGFGCRGLSSADVAATAPVNLEFWTVTDDVDALNALIAAYRVQRPFLSITLRQLSPAEFYPRLVEALAEDKGPDIVSVNVRDLGLLQSKLSPMPANFSDTTVTVQKSQIGGDQTIVNTQTVALPTARDIENVYVRTVAKDVIRQGGIYGLPLSLDTLALFYNKDLLDRSGVPEPPKNWDDFRAAVTKITKVDKVTGELVQSGVALGTTKTVPAFDDVLFALLAQSGVTLADSSGRAVFDRKATANGDDPLTAVLNFITDHANPGRVVYSWNDTLGNGFDRFTRGSVGFFFGYSFSTSLIRSAAPQLNIGVLPFLQLENAPPGFAANYTIQSVTNKSKNKNEAWGFINFITQPPMVKQYLDQTHRVSALRTYLSTQQRDETLGPFASEALTAENWYRGRNYVGARQALGELLDGWLTINSSTPDNMKEARETLLNRTVARFNQTL